MIWQDIVLSGGAFVMTMLLLPTLLDSEAKINRLTSVPTALIVFSYVAAMWTLGLHFAALTNFLNATFWVYIAIKKPTPTTGIQATIDRVTKT